MKLYIKATSSFKADLEEFDVKKALKQEYKADTRRQDKFIHLALYGAYRLKESCSLERNDELYITSGVGNMDIAQKANEEVKIKGEVLRPFDFINMLGNTTSYYVANALGVKGKNIFAISNNFTYINTLISLYASLHSSKRDAVLGSVDLVPKPALMLNRVLGLSPQTKLLSASSYQKLSLNAEGALGSLEFDTQTYSLDEVQEIVKTSDIKVVYTPKTDYFETMASYYINTAVQEREDLLYVDKSQERYKLIYYYHTR